MTRRLKLLVSIDTEEDNWIATRDDVSVENVRALPELHRFLVGLDLRPTYFVDYPVASVPWSADVLRELANDGRAEIGAHLHPWNTPPIEEPLTDENTMMCNLPIALQRDKISFLKATLTEATGRVPTSFRAGRFGLGDEGVQLLIDEGFTVDSSVTPFVSWRAQSHGSDHSRAPMGCYRLDGRGPLDRPAPAGPLIEVPLSCGFTRRPFGWRTRVQAWLDRPVARRLRAHAVASRSGLVRRVIASPETDRLEDLLRLARCLIDEGASFLHFFFHSPSLVPGLSPFVRSDADRRRLFADVETLVESVARRVAIEPATLGEAAEVLCT